MNGIENRKNDNILSYLGILLKGFAMGAANVIPGVSGGTIALITGIFNRIINSLNNLMKFKNWRLFFKGQIKDFWIICDINFLIALFAGLGLSIATVAKIMKHALLYYPIQTWSFFFAMIICSAIIILNNIKQWRTKDFISIAIGFVIGLVVCTLPPSQSPDELWFIFVCGIISICTMILPGISGSFILIILGKYDYIMNAINNGDIAILSTFILGCIIGLMAFSKILSWLIKHYERITLLSLMGFIIGSLIKVWPWSNSEAITKAELLHKGVDIEQVSSLLATSQYENYHILEACIFYILGIIVVFGLEYFGKKIKSKE